MTKLASARSVAIELYHAVFRCINTYVYTVAGSYVYGTDLVNEFKTLLFYVSKCVFTFHKILTFIIPRLESDGRSFSITLQCSTSQLPVNY